jgi:hypothetical protein
MAREDECERARSRALGALAMQEHGAVPVILDDWLARRESLSRVDWEGVLMAISYEGDGKRREALEFVRAGSDPELAKAAGELLEEGPAEGTPVGTAPASVRGRVLRELKKAVKTHFFDDTPDADTYISALTPDDIPLVNQARAAVLARISDECLYEWYPLRRVVRVLRTHQRESARAAPPAHPAPLEE